MTKLVIWLILALHSILQTHNQRWSFECPWHIRPDFIAWAPNLHCDAEITPGHNGERIHTVSLDQGPLWKLGNVSETHPLLPLFLYEPLEFREDASPCCRWDSRWVEPKHLAQIENAAFFNLLASFFDFSFACFDAWDFLTRQIGLFKRVRRTYCQRSTAWELPKVGVIMHLLQGGTSTSTKLVMELVQV